MPRRKPKPQYATRDGRQIGQRKKLPVKGSSACPTGKTRYPDRAEAVKVLNAIRATSTRSKVPSRIHDEVCEYCGGWHITSLLAPWQDWRG